MALDTVAAASAAARVRAVLALVEDDADGAAVAQVGALVHRVAAVGLNDSIAEGLTLPAVAEGAVATLPADLPSLRSTELDAALLAAAGHPFAVVPDRDGTGTTLLAASSRDRLFPRYGPGSLSAHVGAGAVLVDVPADSGLRRDVDLPADLAGVTGPRTRRVLMGAIRDGTVKDPRRIGHSGDTGDTDETGDPGDTGDTGNSRGKGDAPEAGDHPDSVRAGDATERSPAAN
jgi:2-phospho-L-lactate guanylyltransferase